MFSAGEVFDIAVQIERNGAAFYRKATELAVDKATRDQMMELAEMEDEHEATFISMKKRILKEYADSEWFDPDGEAAGYLQIIAGSKVFDVTAHPLVVLPENPSISDVLQYAIERERESVLFYTGMRKIVPGHLGSEEIDRIICQEMGHVTLLTNKLKNLG